jgi:CDP-diacylglycerol--serine O-phosphatidyltransferase
MSFVAKMPLDSERPHRRGRRLRSLAFVPTLLTLGNLLCGFAAIHFALRTMYDFGAGVAADQAVTLHNQAIERMLPSFLSVGASFIVLGMILDMFDGLVARATRQITNFGGQLDSLADVVTFGVAPATLLVAFMTKELAGDSIVPSPLSDSVLGRLTWLSAAVYVAMAAVRLARFNVEHAKDDFDHRVFRGMPSPGAAAIVVALILFQDQQIVPSARAWLVYSTPVLATTIGLLMVSRIPYRRFHRAYLLGRWPFGQVLFVLLVLAVLIASPALTLLVITLWYGVSGPVFYVHRRWRERGRKRPDAKAASADSAAGTARRSG